MLIIVHAHVDVHAFRDHVFQLTIKTVVDAFAKTHSFAAGAATSCHTTRTGCFIYFFFLLFLFIVFDVLGNLTSSSFCFAIFATTTLAMDTIFFLFIVFNILGYLTTGFFGTAVTSVC